MKDIKTESKEESETNQNSKQNLIPKQNMPVRNGFPCRILLLDGKEIRLQIDKTAKGEELVDRICEFLNLHEKEYFSCSYKENNVKFWLNHDRKLSAQLKGSPWQVTFEVKFYPPNPVSLNDDITRYQLYLQVRSDILTERLPCSFVAQSLLGSYVVQSELGDYDSDEHGGGIGYLRGIRLSISQTDELLEKVAELHRMHRGLSPAEAESKYLENAKSLALYGVHMHPAKDKDGVDIMVGVYYAGLLIHKDQLRITRCTWPKILNISYKRSNFYIKYLPEETEQPDKVIGFRLPTYRLAKRLWKIAVEHHAFFRLKETDPPKRNPYPPFAPKFRYSGRTQYQTRQTSRPSSTLDRPASRHSGPSTPTPSAPTTPISTFRSDKSYKPDGSYQPDGTGPPGYRPTTPKGAVPVAKLDDDFGDSPGPQANEAPLGSGQSPTQHGAPYTAGPGGSYPSPQKGAPYANSVDNRPFMSGGKFSTIENVREIIKEPERVKLAPGKDRKMHLINKPDGSSSGTGSRPASMRSGTPTGRPGSVGGHRPGSPDNPPIVTKNVFITAKLNPTNKDSDGLTPTQEDLLNEAKRRAARGEMSDWAPVDSAHSGPVTTHTYTAPDGTVITEYKTDKDGLIETRIEKRLIVSGDDDFDHDKALAEAIRSVTDMNPDLAVEKIEIQTRADEGATGKI